MDPVCSDSQPAEISLPVQSAGDWSLLHTSPLLNILPGQLSLALLGELGKINPLSGVRLLSMRLEEAGVRVGLLCSPGENITLSWLVRPINLDQVRILTDTEESDLYYDHYA